METDEGLETGPAIAAGPGVAGASSRERGDAFRTMVEPRNRSRLPRRRLVGRHDARRTGDRAPTTAGSTRSRCVRGGRRRRDLARARRVLGPPLAGTLIADRRGPGCPRRRAAPRRRKRAHGLLCACEKAGLTIVGIGPSAGRREFRHLVSRAGASVLVTTAEFRDEPTPGLYAALASEGTALRHHVVMPPCNSARPMRRSSSTAR